MPTRLKDQTYENEYIGSATRISSCRTDTLHGQSPTTHHALRRYVTHTEYALATGSTGERDGVDKAGRYLSLLYRLHACKVHLLGGDWLARQIATLRRRTHLHAGFLLSQLSAKGCRNIRGLLGARSRRGG